jgi:hypothetical protein
MTSQHLPQTPLSIFVEDRIKAALDGCQMQLMEKGVSPIPSLIVRVMNDSEATLPVCKLFSDEVLRCGFKLGNKIRYRSCMLLVIQVRYP